MSALVFKVGARYFGRGISSDDSRKLRDTAKKSEHKATNTI